MKTDTREETLPHKTFLRHPEKTDPIIEEFRKEVAPTLMKSVGDIAAQAFMIRDKRKEYVVAFYLNAKLELIGKDVISVGTTTASLAHPREIFIGALERRATGVVLCHNHPSGNPHPSEEDTRLTKRVAQAGQIIGIELLDHLIVANEGVYSFKTAGVL